MIEQNLIKVSKRTGFFKYLQLCKQHKFSQTVNDFMLRAFLLVTLCFKTKRHEFVQIIVTVQSLLLELQAKNHIFF